MLDHFTIFTKGGVVLWSFSANALNGNPVDNLVRTVLIEERAGESSFNSGPYTMKWRLANEFELIFVAVYQKLLSLLYVDELLTLVQSAFCALFAAQLKPLSRCGQREFPFDADFQRCLRDAQAKYDEQRAANRGPRRFEETARGQSILRDKGKEAVKDGGKGGKKSNKPGKSSGRSSNNSNNKSSADDSSGGSDDDQREPQQQQQDETSGQSPRQQQQQFADEELPATAAAAAAAGGDDEAGGGGLSEEQLAANRRALLEKKKQGGRGGSTGGSKKSVKSEPPTSPERTSRIKREPTMDELDYTKRVDAGGQQQQQQQRQQQPVDIGRFNLDDWHDQQPGGDVDDDDDDDDAPPASPSSAAAAAAGGRQPAAARASGGWFSFVTNLVSGRSASGLEEADLQPVLQRFKEHLIGKNVAADIAERLCESVRQSLQGKRLGTFQSVRATVRSAVEQALVRILTPRRNIDVLREAREAKARGVPFVMTFCGVNGVGKSTSLAKVAALLQQHSMRVLVAACDTFRSGAVEQLRTHAARLQFVLFERGYRSEPTQIAVDAVREAKQKGFDVVLIDTAGRMQDNEPLMRSLSKLVNTVRPHLVLFVGEALVGNDAIDQLVKFNQAMLEFGGVTDPRRLDGILLTKFDCIDDQVGAALSMVYISGLEVVFVGTGQQYCDLKRLNVQAVSRALLSGLA